MAPIVQVNVLAALEVNMILVLVPLQICLVGAFVTAGIGLTVTVIVNVGPTQGPAVEVGVIIY